jgi:hypothetical protein
MSGPDGRYGQPAYRPDWQAAAPKQASRPDPAKLLGLAVAGLGGLNFIWGFLPQLKAPRIDADLSVFAVGPAYVPILLLIAGLLAMAAFLPGSERSRLAVAAVSVGGAVGAIVSLGMTGPVELVATGQVSKGLGAILLVIFGIIQAVIAIAGYVVGADFSPRAPGRGGPAGVPDPAAGAQPGWFGPAAGAPSAGAPSAGTPSAGLVPPLGTPPGWVQPAGQQPWWPPAPMPAPMPTQVQAPTPLPAPEPNEAVTGPQVVIGPEFRRDSEQH